MSVFVSYAFNAKKVNYNKDFIVMIINIHFIALDAVV